MPFILTSLSSDLPNTTIGLTNYKRSDEVLHWQITPSSPRATFPSNWKLSKNESTQLTFHIVDNNGRSALVFVGDHEGRLNVQGSVEEVQLETNTTRRFFSDVVGVAVRLRADGGLEFEVTTEGHGFIAGGAEAKSVVVRVPAFSRA